ncbi:MAG: acyltransferase 3 [Pseudonocardia sp.]|jgi:peptidoglycan/LPS O-acetylase OafA/YrhL|uniref:acyltransferase family protein n=1 Tax=Pseudonocardia sp. TaxID=60912 RepID=UPI002603428E|nr:acyltransferase family protein [Pseudonocardia sp.]MCU1629453.1 acyltransferase 3 [Pseudonocardia sp.]
MTQIPSDLPGPSNAGSGRPAPDASATRTTPTFRPELQGLRALAVALVVVYHVWIGRVSGGVDVFFVLSGFLITGALFRSASRGPLSLGPMWARQATRLVPAAFVVLIVCIPLGVALLPEARWLQTVKEVLASAVFMENWRLGSDAVDYAAQHDTASVVQHFWSLSIQVQFYVVWPLLVALVALTAGYARDKLRIHLTLTMIGVLVASLTFSIVLTLANQPLAYFHSLTRAWEFALGGLLALVIDTVVLSRALRLAMGWAGVLGLVACGLVLQVDRVFPGYAALWPTLCAVMILLAGMTGSPLGADRVLGSRPMQYLGDLSYALYLWHWPVLVFFLVVRDRAEVGLPDGAVVVAISVVLAIATHHLVEEPLRRARLTDRSRTRICAAMVVVVLVAAGGWQISAYQRADDLGAIGDVDHPGAMALREGLPNDGRTAVEPVPPMVTISQDWGQQRGAWTCRPVPDQPQVPECTLATDGTPERTLVVVGDSHSQQYVDALQPIAESRNWRLVTFLLGACPFSTRSDTDPNNTDCVGWNQIAADTILALHPDAVFAAASSEVRPGLTEHTPAGYVEQWRRMNDAGIPVVAFRDNPRFASSRPDCVQQLGADAPECGVPRADVYAATAPYEQIPDLPPNVSFLDMADALCDPEQCPAVVGNVLVYMDDNHVTATYMRSMAPMVEERLDQALGW